MTEKTRKVKKLGSGGKGGIIELALEHGRKPIIGGKDAAIVPVDHEVTPDHRTKLLNGVILRFIKRKLTVYYKQTILGPAWLLLNPLSAGLMCALFTFEYFSDNFIPD